MITDSAKAAGPPLYAIVIQDGGPSAIARHLGRLIGTATVIITPENVIGHNRRRVPVIKRRAICRYGIVVPEGTIQNTGIREAVLDSGSLLRGMIAIKFTICNRDA